MSLLVEATTLSLPQEINLMKCYFNPATNLGYYNYLFS